MRDDIDVAVRQEYIGQRWAAALLFFGSIFGLLAFLLVAIVAVYEHEFAPPKPECFDMQFCPSGIAYFPDTVSEMVSNSSDPAGKLFQCFAVIGSILLLMSRYPLHLANAYSRNLSGIRATVVPIGMLLVAWITIMPVAKRRAVDKFVSSCHTLGAVSFMFGYTILELITIQRLSRVLDSTQKRWRRAAMISALFFIVSFVLAGHTLSNPHICCQDAWEPTPDAFERVYGNITERSELYLDLLKQRYGSKVLINSAHGTFRHLKFLSFGAEVGTGLSVVASHLVIWYFCKERFRMVPSVNVIRWPEGHVAREGEAAAQGDVVIE